MPTNRFRRHFIKERTKSQTKKWMPFFRLLEMSVRSPTALELLSFMTLNSQLERNPKECFRRHMLSIPVSPQKLKIHLFQLANQDGAIKFIKNRNSMVNYFPRSNLVNALLE
jgi:hypothetical protein